MSDTSDTPDESYIESIEVYDLDDFYEEFGYPDDEEPEFLSEEYDDEQDEYEYDDEGRRIGRA